jgi:2-succinyl-5-enolpyruvyl-6-hydroxy-3-cyclohexene-1-carboxylate synthase
MPEVPDKAANAGQAFATVVVDELVRHGVRHAVLAPGSRSTPLALAFAADERVRLHVRIDERSAAFLALGIARASGVPVPVLCTSGTAAAHFHAAVLEADQSRVPLLALTADRPPELRGVGANQTINQIGLYGDAVRWSVDVGVPEARPDAVGYWRSLVAQAVAVATGRSSSPAGPVHLNLPLREPLTAVDDGIGFPFPLTGRPDGAPWTASFRATDSPPDDLAEAIAGIRHGVVLAGDGLLASEVDALLAFADRAGWPVIAEPHSNARRGDCALRATDALLRDDAFVAGHRPELVVVAGRLGLSRATAGWLAQSPYVVVDRDGRWADPQRRAKALVRCDLTALDAALTSERDDSWLAGWTVAAQRVGAAVDAVLDETDRLTEPRVARDLAAGLPDAAALVVASSMPIRDLDLTMRPRSGLRIVANRGVSGIDGFVSTAQGVALAHPGPTWALAGDLSLVHDANGLAVQEQPDLTVVVLNNDGGGIISLLSQATDTDPATFERLFGTPHGVDLAALCAAYGVTHQRLETADDLRAALAASPTGIRVAEVRTDRADNAALHGRLRDAAADALR